MEFVFKEAKIACFSVTSFQTIKSEQSSMEFDKYGKKKSENRVYYMYVTVTI